MIPIYIPTTKDNSTKVLYYIIYKIYLVNNLKTNIFIRNDIIGLEKIIINISKGKAIIGSYGTTINIISR